MVRKGDKTWNGRNKVGNVWELTTGKTMRTN